MFNNNHIHIKQGKTPRAELNLPQLHFIACDDWMDKLGNTAFCAWLKLWTLADRSKSDREYDKVPETMNDLAEKLGVSKPTFYNKVVRPLWNYGFIDLVEYDLSRLKKQGTKENPVNIIVYRYPQNRHDLATKPLEKIRDYDTQYNTEKREYKSFLGKSRTVSQLKNLTGEKETKTEDSQSKKLTGSQLKNLTGPSQKFLQNNYLKTNDLNINDLNNNKAVTQNKAPSPKKEVVSTNILPVVVELLNKHEIKINKTALAKWSKLAEEQTIVQAVEDALQRENLKNPIGYITRMLETGYTPSQTPQTKRKKIDLPDHIVNQIENRKIAVSSEGLSEEQKREAQELLRQLGEI